MLVSYLLSQGESLQTKAKYFNEGYISNENGEGPPPGFWNNLLSGGRLQAEWEETLKQKK